jgi:signal transduction histidine kinase
MKLPIADALKKLSPTRRTDTASVLLPFLIISIGLGVLAWRSYELSVRMERGVSDLAAQYVAYASDINARRVDTAVNNELFRAAEEWQQIERRVASPNAGVLQEWLQKNRWIVSAIYVPDFDPTSSVYVSEVGHSDATPALTREFYTSSGSIKYTYDAARLLDAVRGSVVQEISGRELLPGASSMPFQRQSELDLIPRPAVVHSTVKTPDGIAYSEPLHSPLSMYAVRSSVRMSYVGSGWENHRLVSAWLSVMALALTALGAYLAMRGLKREAEAMKLRGALIANVSHELRTPLSMIRLGAETLKRGATKLREKERQELEDTILREVLHLSHLVENVLDVARIQHKSTKALAFTPVQPRELVLSLMTTYESWIRSKGFTVEMVIEDVEEQLWDRDAVSRALLNLVDNAIKYSADEKELCVTLRHYGDDIELSVRDKGIGIAAKDVAKIFEPYFRARFSDTQTRRGAGLGLTLVQQIVVSHGGRIEVESEPGKGSTFRLIFPQTSRVRMTEPGRLPRPAEVSS